jgi:hypothetical protein
MSKSHFDPTNPEKYTDEMRPYCIVFLTIDMDNGGVLKCLLDKDKIWTEYPVFYKEERKKFMKPGSLAEEIIQRVWHPSRIHLWPEPPDFSI